MLDNLENQAVLSDLKKLFFKFMLFASSFANIAIIIWWNTGDRGIELYAVIMFYAALIISIVIISLFKGAKAFVGAVMGFISSLVICLCLMVIAQMLMPSSII
jgi:hypothetical protein